MRLIVVLFLLCFGSANCQETPTYSEEEVSIVLEEGTLFGTLTIPVGKKKKIPVVLLIPGSGPTDRDCNSPALGLRTDAFVMLAHGLAENGIATLRIDKRISGKSASTFQLSNSSVKFVDFIADNERWIRWLRADKRFGKLTVCGHSQGALTGLTAITDEPADAYISLCGAGRPADVLMREQFITQYPEQKEVVNQFFDSLMVGTYDKSAPLLLKMSIPADLAPFLMQYASYDPAEWIAKVECRVLIIQGERDLQVPIQDAERLHAAAPKSQFVVIPEMNHPLKVAPEDRQGNIDTYGQYTLPLQGKLMKTIADFVLNK